MKKLFIKFKDGVKITYTIKDSVSYVPYFERHSKINMESAILQYYPKKNNEPIDLLEGWEI